MSNYYHYQLARPKRTHKLLAAGVALLFALTTLLMVFNQASAAVTTEVVVGDTAVGVNEPGWLFNRDVSTSTPFEFNTDESSIGQGSIYVQPITNDSAFTIKDKFIAEYFYLSSADDFESFSYDFQIAGSGGAGDANKFYLNVYANLPTSSVDNFYDCRFDYTPTTGSTTDFTPFSVDPSTAPSNVAGGSCGAATIGDLPEGSTIRAFAINVGDTSATDTGLAGYLDNVVVSASGDTTTYDFEAGKIFSPTAGQEVEQGEQLFLSAFDNESVNSGVVQWAVRQGTCAPNTATVAGNVDGYNDSFMWENGEFSSTLSTTDWELGEHCFIFNPTNGGRYTQEFMLVNNNPDSKDDCKKGGWADFGFRNQGQCIRFVNTGQDSRS